MAGSNDPSTCSRRIFRMRYTLHAGSQLPFPPNTGGFLYFHRPPPGAPDLAGDIRFRVTNDPDPASFAAGHDLQLYGVPWTKALAPWAGAVRGFESMLLDDGLIMPKQLDRLRMLTKGAGRAQIRGAIYAYKQPFTIDLRNTTTWSTYDGTRIWVLGLDAGVDMLKMLHIYPCSGVNPWAFINPDTARSTVLDFPGIYIVTTYTRTLCSCHVIITVKVVVHLEKSKPKAPNDPPVVVRIRQVMSLDGSAPEHHADAVGTLLGTTFADRRTAALSIFRKSTLVAAGSLLREMPEGTDF